MLTSALVTALIVTALGWTRERALRKGDLTRLAEAAANLELAAEREVRLTETAKLGTQSGLIAMVMQREARGIVSASHPDDDPGATRH